MEIFREAYFSERSEVYLHVFQQYFHHISHYL